MEGGTTTTVILERSIILQNKHVEQFELIEFTYQGLIQHIICQLHEVKYCDQYKGKVIRKQNFIAKGRYEQELTFFLGAVISCTFASAYVAMSLMAALTLSRVSLPFMYLVGKTWSRIK